MRRFSLRLCAVIAVLSVVLTACVPVHDSAATSGSSSSQSGASNSQPQLPPADEVVAVVEETPPEPKLTQADMDEVLSEIMADYSATAVSVATIEMGQLSQSGAWGWAEKGKREMTADTKLRVASLSKVVVGMCAMAMAEEELLDIDTPLSDYWGNCANNPYSKGQPTIRTLMTHTSSLKNLEITRGLSHLKSLLSSKSSWRSMEPGNGANWTYSNFGMCILGTTLELASDQVLDSYFQERFCQPMGLNASFHGGNFSEEELATLYTTGGVSRSAAKHASGRIPTTVGDGASYYPGGLTISAVDLAKLVAVLANGGNYDGVEYLTPLSVEAMESPQFSVDPGQTAAFDQCLILRRQENILGQNILYYHTGSAYGVFSLLSFNPETGNGVVVLTTGAPRNTNEYGLYALCSDLSEALYARMEADPV